MKLFINTINIEDVRIIKDFDIISGINIDLSDIEALGIKDNNQILTHYNSICNLIKKELLVNIKAKDYENILREVDILMSINELITVKLPATTDGIKAIINLSKQKINTLCDSIMSSSQAILAAEAGASYINIPIINTKQSGIDSMHLISQIVNIYNEQGYDTFILADQISSSIELSQIAILGADGLITNMSTFLTFFKNTINIVD
ncbi:MAG TPA: transaldolase family protein [Bacteroidales bacterium]|nr:transaldolase family protein [Bacteroidales bacterium]